MRVTEADLLRAATVWDLYASARSEMAVLLGQEETWDATGDVDPAHWHGTVKKSDRKNRLSRPF